MRKKEGVVNLGFLLCGGLIMLTGCYVLIWVGLLLDWAELVGQKRKQV